MITKVEKSNFTGTDHPRYYEWFAGGREDGVGLCCEAAAELILQKRGYPQWDVTGEADEEPDEFEQALFAMRDRLFAIIKPETPVSFDEKLAQVVAYDGLFMENKETIAMSFNVQSQMNGKVSHNPRILTGIRQSGFLLHGQCVDIAAQCHAAARASGSMDQRYNGGWYRPFDCINPVFLQLLSNQGRCPYLVSSNLRMAVNIPANLYHLREIFLRSFFYRTRLKFPPSCMASGSHCLFSMVSMFASQT